MTDDQKKQLEQQFIYILECSDGSYYTGMTKNLEKKTLGTSKYDGG